MVCTDRGIVESTVIVKLSDAASGTPVFVHLDAHCLVVEKPSGLLCVPGRGADKQDCLASRVQALVPDALVVHRLDMATSGLWLMARGADMQRRLSRAFAEREVTKRYVAVVAGRLEPPADAVGGWGTIDLPLAADWPNRPRRVVDAQAGKPSITRWRVLGHDTAGDTTRVELAPVTGRSHQLRVHLQALGHPILGDTLYAPAGVQARAPRLLLHATGLRIAHPAGAGSMEWSSPPPF
ncbi:MAG: RluA family pseudouridine synthase [Comamonadaceae bacterium]|nr:MAG: RluA family pseudouridine synthase [Comamonadaceae bacterium]